jgi:hypothetical protein
MSGKIVTAMLVVVGVIHLLPLNGLRGPEQLAAMYGVPVSGPDLEILMRHRAVLFGLLGVFLLIAAFKPSLQVTGIIVGALSVLTFIGLAWSVGGYNTSIRRVVIADLVALGCLAVAASLKALARA